MIEIVQALHRAPIAQVDSDNAIALERKIEAAIERSAASQAGRTVAPSQLNRDLPRRRPVLQHLRADKGGGRELEQYEERSRKGLVGPVIASLGATII